VVNHVPFTLIIIVELRCLNVQTAFPLLNNMCCLMLLGLYIYCLGLNFNIFALCYHVFINCNHMLEDGELLDLKWLLGYQFVI